MTPLEKMLQDMGSVREDGSDKFFGMENVSLPILWLVPRLFSVTNTYLCFPVWEYLVSC